MMPGSLDFPGSHISGVWLGTVVWNLGRTVHSPLHGDAGKGDGNGGYKSSEGSVKEQARSWRSTTGDDSLFYGLAGVRFCLVSFL